MTVIRNRRITATEVIRRGVGGLGWAKRHAVSKVSAIHIHIDNNNNNNITEYMDEPLQK